MMLQVSPARTIEGEEDGFEIQRKQSDEEYITFTRG